MSLPTRGEWIEIIMDISKASRNASLPTRGEWIEINFEGCGFAQTLSLFPHGESGLKYKTCRCSWKNTWSLPTRGEWIEIILIYRQIQGKLVSSHTGRVD